MECNRKKKSWGSSFKAITAITTNIWNLPTPIRRICNVQFFAWFGWFPFLFYSTTWVAEIYDETALDGSGDDTSDAVGQATRAGSFAFLVYSLVSLGASFALPLIVSPSYDDQKKTTPSFQLCIRGKTYTITPSKYLKIKFLNLPRAWTASHVIFLLAMFSTFFVNNVTGASIVIGVCGISWSMTMWAPFSLLGEYISEMEDAKQQQQQQRLSDGNDDDENHLAMHPMAMSSRFSLAAGGAGLGTEGGLYQLVEQELDSDPEETDAGIEMQQSTSKKQSKHSLPPSMNPSSSGDIQLDHSNDEDDHAIMLTSHMDQEHNNNNNLDSSQVNSSSTPSAGVLLGIHNMYIVMPQFLVTFLSSIIFHFLENGSSKSEEASPSTIAIVLRFGAIMAGVAGYLSTRIGRTN